MQCSPRTIREENVLVSTVGTLAGIRHSRCLRSYGCSKENTLYTLMLKNGI